jgi:hypothetical protein
LKIDKAVLARTISLFFSLFMFISCSNVLYDPRIDPEAADVRRLKIKGEVGVATLIDLKDPQEIVKYVITWSEAVDFAQEILILSNAQVLEFSHSGNQTILTLKAINRGDASVKINSGTVMNQDGDKNKLVEIKWTY